MKLSNILMIVGALAILGLFFFPLWSITLEAPQYPIPLSMDIFIDHFQDYRENDIKNINLMNHYVGMKFIPESIPEFKIFPAVIGGMSLIGVLIGVFKKYNWFLIWGVVMILLATAGMVDFYLWEYDYGHDLDPNAIMKFTDENGEPMGFQPPFFGSKPILNFVAHSYPGPGAFFLFGGMVLAFIAYFVGRNEKSKMNN